MPIYITRGEHWNVPGTPSKAFLGLSGAQTEAAELVNLLRADMLAIIDDARMPWDQDYRDLAGDVLLPIPEATAEDWESVLRIIQVLRAIETDAIENEQEVTDWMAGLFDADDCDCDVWIEDLALADPPRMEPGEGPAGMVCDALNWLGCVEHAECFDKAEGGFFVVRDGREFGFGIYETPSSAWSRAFDTPEGKALVAEVALGVFIDDGKPHMPGQLPGEAPESMAATIKRVVSDPVVDSALAHVAPMVAEALPLYGRMPCLMPDDPIVITPPAMLDLPDDTDPDDDATNIVAAGLDLLDRVGWTICTGDQVRFLDADAPGGPTIYRAVITKEDN